MIRLRHDGRAGTSKGQMKKNSRQMTRLRLKATPRHTEFNQESGSALVIVLWVIMLLAILVGSFAFDAHVEARITSYYRKRTKAEYLARSGIVIADMMMSRIGELKKIDDEDVAESEDADEWWFGKARSLSQGLSISGMTHELGGGTITLDIIPEPAKRNVNKMTDEDWEKLFAVCNVPEEMWPELIDSFADWLDGDHIARADGAETEDYYETLDPPYESKNGPLDTVSELLLVKGFNSTILFGGEIQVGYEEEEPETITGISQYLTIYGDGKNGNQLNVNAASSNVLMTLPNVDDIIAGAIIEEREGWLDEEGESENHSFKNVADLLSRIPDLPASLKAHFSTESTIFRITSTGTMHGVDKKVWCIVRYLNNKMTILRWGEE